MPGDWIIALLVWYLGRSCLEMWLCTPKIYVFNPLIVGFRPDYPYKLGQFSSCKNMYDKVRHASEKEGNQNSHFEWKA